MQVTYLLGKGTTILTWFIMLGFVAYNYIGNIQVNHDIRYVTQMFDPFMTLTLSDFSKSSFFLMTYYPLLLVLPTSCAYISDRKSQVDVYIKGRVGCKAYFRGQLISVFLVTFLVFTIPFLLETALGFFCFSKDSMGVPTNMEYIHTIEETDQYCLYSIWVRSRVGYTILWILLFGLVTAILAAFNYAVTTLKIFYYKILTFFPVYILFYLISFLSKLLKPSYTLNYFFILRMFNTKEKNFWAYGLFLLLLLTLTVLLTERKIRKEQTL